MDLQFLVAAQWQGSGSARALHLTDGSNAILGDLPASKTTVIDIPLGAGESLGSGVRRLSAIQAVRDRMAEALTTLTGTVVSIGGDCGMVLRSIFGEGFASLALDNPLPASKVILAGTRSFDEPEAQWVSDQGIRALRPEHLNADALVSALRATGAKYVYLHIDLDVLDPAEFSSLDFPEPFGVSLSTLLDSIRAVVSEFTLAGAGICEFAPATPDAATDDLPSILRIVGAVTA